jgi:GNAT superfamily N-acetyltransferase
MGELKFISHYKNIDKYRLSFNRLANNTFGIDFEKWYQMGLWNDRYIPYSYIDGDKVVANISVNVMEIILEGKSKSAVQIGTVMIDPDYRGRGLAGNLMKKVLSDYEDEYELIYLFANEDVLDFYPKFGFKNIKESKFVLEVSTDRVDDSSIRKLDINNKPDLDIVRRLARERRSLSNILSAAKAEHILTWYAVNIFPNHTYYIEEADTIVMFDEEENKLQVYDIISINEVAFNNILMKIASKDTKEVIFHFTPDFKDITPKIITGEPDENMFIIGNLEDIPDNFKYPITAHA